ncbi:uncharacterized protein A4U43_C08F34510 [Asparagus officinalis]|uniref:ankyrin repeat-containing protein At5g02620-like n=1 Tax=Asparagus officinalis TaxID=4686 RepID=UPI00098E0BBD|nr:ankyrin repeat-containing protein At5g02620-like [Asparagus officinalis]ONK61878.1 uncharacterized protein A4U43_C08F34510 [Asparagus officinalis]
MESSNRKKIITKQLTGKRDDTPLHSAARAGNFVAMEEIISETKDEELKDLLCKQNQAGEIALYVASEYGHADMVKELVRYHNLETAGIKAKNGYDALHIAAKQGDLDIVKELLKSFPELAMTAADLSNTTSLHTAAAQGHVEVVKLLFEADATLAKIARSNGKTALHSASRNGHLEVVKALIHKEPGLLSRTDKKGQIALHMAVKGHNLELVDELLKHEPSLINLADSKGNTALHIATRKCRPQILKKLLEFNETNKNVINKSGETALDTAEQTGNSEIITLLHKHGAQSGKGIKPPNSARELKQNVSDIKHGVHSQLEHTLQTRKRVHGIAKRLRKLHAEGLNNAINSTTVVAVLIATVAFAAIFTVPGQYVGHNTPEFASGRFSLGEAYTAPNKAFMIFLIFDSLALFISLAVVVAQTSVVVVESKAKKQMMAIINKLMWLACVLMSVAFLALSFIVVGDSQRLLAVGVAVMGTMILVATLGTMCYWVIMHRMDAKRLRSIKRSSLSRSWSWSATGVSDAELLYTENQKLYAI